MPNCGLLFNVVFDIPDPLCFYMNFRISLSVAAKKKKKGRWDFDSDCTDSVDQLDKFCHLTNIIFLAMNQRCHYIHLGLL